MIRELSYARRAYDVSRATGGQRQQIVMMSPASWTNTRIYISYYTHPEQVPLLVGSSPLLLPMYI